MKTLFFAPDHESILQRLDSLQPSATRQWGKMNPAQMLCHCTRGLEAATGQRPMKQLFIGKLISWLARGSVLGEKALGKNSPTDPTFVVADERDFEAERGRLRAEIDRFVTRGPAEAGKAIHAFFGKMSGDDWGVLMYKHLDHHFRQFGV